MANNQKEFEELKSKIDNSINGYNTGIIKRVLDYFVSNEDSHCVLDSNSIYQSKALDNSSKESE